MRYEEDLFHYKPEDRYIIWGAHPEYADGAWIKIAWPEDEVEIRRRTKEGFSLKKVPMGRSPNQ